MEPKSAFPVYKYRTFWLPGDYLRATLATEDHFTARASDVLISTASPSANITWLNSLMFSIMPSTGEKNDNITLVEPHKLFPFLEGHDRYCSKDTYMDVDTYPSPRTFNTHIPYSLLPNSLKDFNCKIIYLCKEPKDNFLSWWCYYYKNKKNTVCETLSMEEAAGLYCSGMFPWGPVWEHMLEYWRDHQRRPERTLFLKYGDVKKDMTGTVLKLAEFMGWRDLTGEKEKRRLVEGVADNICRSHGRLEDGDWKGHLMPEMVERMNKITQKKLHGSGLTF